MYVYLYDSFLEQRKYISIIKAIENRLTDYGISGKILRLNNFIDAKPIIDDEIKRGAKNIVIVGNDKTFGLVLSRGAGSNCVFGFLPIGIENNTVAPVLGIPINEESVEVLAKRKKEKMDIGLVNNRFFVSQLHVMASKVQVIYDRKFKVTAKDKMEVVVCNFQPFYWKKDKKDKEIQVVHPQDGKLEAFLRPLTKSGWFGYKYEEPSIFPFEEMEIIGENAFLVETDGRQTKEISLKLKLAKSKIEMIVGKNRMF